MMRVVARHSRAADPVDELYAVPLKDFVAKRDAIAKRLAAAGNAAEARSIRRLPKPKATIWALNKVARTHEKAVRTFLAAFDALKQAQLRKPDALPTAAQQLREATETVVHLATDAIASAGNRVALDTHRRLGSTLRGAAAGARERLVRGELTDEISAPGFEVFGGASPATVRSVPRTRTGDASGTGRRGRAIDAPGRERGGRAIDTSRTGREGPARRSPTARTAEAVERIETRRAAQAAIVEERRARDDLLRRRAGQLEDEADSKERDARRAASEALEARQRLRELEMRARAARGAAVKSRRIAVSARRRAERKRS